LKDEWRKPLSSLEKGSIVTQKLILKFLESMAFERRREQLKTVSVTCRWTTRAVKPRRAVSSSLPAPQTWTCLELTKLGVENVLHSPIVLRGCLFLSCCYKLRGLLVAILPLRLIWKRKKRHKAYKPSFRCPDTTSRSFRPFPSFPPTQTHFHPIQASAFHLHGSHRCLPRSQSWKRQLDFCSNISWRWLIFRSFHPDAPLSRIQGQANDALFEVEQEVKRANWSLLFQKLIQKLDGCLLGPFKITKKITPVAY